MAALGGRESASKTDCLSAPAAKAAPGFALRRLGSEYPKTGHHKCAQLADITNEP